MASCTHILLTDRCAIMGTACVFMVDTLVNKRTSMSIANDVKFSDHRLLYAVTLVCWKYRNLFGSHLMLSKPLRWYQKFMVSGMVSEI